MISKTLRRLFAFTAATGFAASLAACGPDDAPQSHAVAPLLSQNVAQPGWSMDDLAGVDPAFLANDAIPLPRALPMRASYRGDYGYAPAYDYGPQYADEGYYDGGHYANSAGADDYQWLALAASLGGMLGDAPPDYAFGYGGVQPWAWETGDRYLRYAEPIDGGYRYYYYEPDSYTPFLVADPYYSYGYRDDRLVAIYDRSGRVIDARRAERQRRAAHDYYARARQMYVAAHREPRFGVAAPLWQRHRAEIVREQRRWDQARGQRKAWQRWDTQNEPRLKRDWAGEALVRREAERGFAGWQKADFKTPAPKFYSPRQRQAQLRKVAEIRHSEHVAGAMTQQRQAATEQRDRVQRQRAAQRRQVAVAERTRQVRQADGHRQRDRQQVRAQKAQHQQQQQVQARRAKAQRQDHAQQAVQERQAHKVKEQRQAPAQRPNNAQQRARRQQAQQQTTRAARQGKQVAERRGGQQAQRAARQQQQAQRASGQRRQQAAREHQLEAQHASQQRQAAHAHQAERASQQRQAARAQQAQQQARRGAAQQQAQARQAAQRQPRAAKSQPSGGRAQQAQQQARRGAAQQQAQARQAAQRQPRAAKSQPSGGRAQQAHGNGHGRKDR